MPLSRPRNLRVGIEGHAQDTVRKAQVSSTPLCLPHHHPCTLGDIRLTYAIGRGLPFAVSTAGKPDGQSRSLPSLKR